ncbi:MAG TPA: GNAT family N-acetyltransferase [Gemmatimonadales bacterium]|jgi:hypothetical protein
MPDLIRHDPDAMRFTLEMGGAEAYLQYGELDAGALDFRVVYVPDALRGSGVAAKIVAHALAYARAQGREVVASCGYVRRHLEREAQAASQR